MCKGEGAGPRVSPRWQEAWEAGAERARVSRSFLHRKGNSSLHVGQNVWCHKLGKQALPETQTPGHQKWR